MSRFDDEAAKRIRKINAQITTVQRIYGKDSSVYKRIVSTISKAGGTGTRFTKKMFTGGLRDIARATRALETVEHSQYLTKAGRAKIGEKARNTFAMNYKEFSTTTLELMYDTFKNSPKLHKLMEFTGSSEMIVDAIMSAYELEKNLQFKDTDFNEMIENNWKTLVEDNQGATSQERADYVLKQLDKLLEERKNDTM